MNALPAFFAQSVSFLELNVLSKAYNIVIISVSSNCISPKKWKIYSSISCTEQINYQCDTDTKFESIWFFFVFLFVMIKSVNYLAYLLTYLVTNLQPNIWLTATSKNTSAQRPTVTLRSVSNSLSSNPPCWVILPTPTLSFAPTNLLLSLNISSMSLL